MSQPSPARPRLRLSPLAFTWTFVPGTKESLESFMAALWNPEGAVSPKLKELIFLRSSWVNECGRCWTSHLASARQRGLTNEQIDAIAEPDRWREFFSDEEILVLDLSTQICRSGHDLGEELIARTRQYFDDQQISELLLMAGMSNMFNRVSEASEQFYHGRVLSGGFRKATE